MHATVKLDPLTSLRFFAAAMIVLGHSHRLFGSLGLATHLSLAQGVSFFFVLSGFILAYNYPTLTTRAEVGGFLKARIARIWPAHIAAIGLLFLLTSDLNLGGLSSTSARYFAAIANLFLFQSIVPLRDVFLSFNGVAWSISTEMFFYFAFPLLITSILPGWKIKLLFLSLIVILYLWFATAWKVPSDDSLPQLNLMGLLYVNPFVRLLEFFVGVLAYSVYMKFRTATRDQPLWLFSIAEVLIVGFALLSIWLSPHITTFLGWQGDLANVVHFYLVKSGSFLVFAPLIIIFAFGKGILSRVLSWYFMILLGEISFALYLVHTTVLKWYESNASYFSDWNQLSKVIGYWLLSLILAFLLHKSIENPCRKLILSFSKVKATEALKEFFSGYQIGYMLLTAIVLIAMKSTPILTILPPCPSGGCELIVKKAQFSTTAKFGDYVSLLAIRSQPSANGDQSLDMVFKVERPLPSGHHLAVHMVTLDGTIVTKFDSEIVKNSSLKQGELWAEHIQIPSRFLTPEIVRLGLAIYSDPKSPLSVTYPNTDYDGRRMLVDLPMIIPPPSCPSGGCELIVMVKESPLPTAAKFGDYVSLLAIRSQPSSNGDQSLDMVFKVERPLPSGHHLAVHMVTLDGTIVTKFDSEIVKNRSLKQGELWVEHIQIPSRFLTPEVVRLGLAIYSDPKSPLSVTYPNTDYDGRRMLVDLAMIIPPPSCPSGECELIVKESPLPTAAKFGDYVSLLAIRSKPSTDGDQSLDMVFKVERPLPSGHHLAVHMVAADGSIVTKFDSEIVKNRSLKQGELWAEHIQIPSRFLTPQVVKLGLAIYYDPKSPLPVTYPNTDYDGKRMLVDLAMIGLVK
jgi:peptidoglycan/LPS O-acetylase OafA/YrhL